MPPTSSSPSTEAETEAGGNRFIFGSARRDVLVFLAVALLMMAASYRLRVYFRSPPEGKKVSISLKNKALPS